MNTFEQTHCNVCAMPHGHCMCHRRVGINHRNWSVGDLHRAFQLLKMPNWKSPIDAWVPGSSVECVLDAIEYMTGTVGRVIGVNESGACRVKATGYLMGPCGPS
jgi:hypothetical protein